MEHWGAWQSRDVGAHLEDTAGVGLRADLFVTQTRMSGGDE
jgi:hypothetical protein